MRRVGLGTGADLILETASTREVEERFREEVYVTRVEVAAGQGLTSDDFRARSK